MTTTLPMRTTETVPPRSRGRGFHGQQIASALVGLAILLVAATSQAASSNLLRYRAEVSGNDVRLSDIFTNVDASADAVIGKAPAPGASIDVEIAKIQRLVHYYRLDWVPPDNAPRVITIKRSGTNVPASQLQNQLESTAMASLRSRGVANPMFTVKTDSPLTSFVVQPDDVTNLIVDFTLNGSGDRFTATLVNKQAGSQTSVVNGRLIHEVEVPVAARLLHPGRVITARDVTVKRVPKHKVSPNQLLDRRAVIGQSITRRINVDEGFDQYTLAAPVVVKRDSLVTVAFARGGLQMTVQARAASDGAVGDTIKLKNTRTQRSIEAVVTAANRAVIP
ncbi:MAG: flagellar basal body P-ring formation chaperone FlgA [Alphaproteobacteria bacterium]|nr:flagellar basal body P-ring formation chaperone FlgA [Alphaproteobacteria bacterium]